jgi:hypothetical protein
MQSVILGAIGKTNVYVGPKYLGAEGWIDDVNYLSADYFSQQKYSAEKVLARLCINASGGALAGGKLVRHDVGATYGPGKGVGIVSAGVEVGLAGIVDPSLGTAGVPDGETFLLIVGGPTWARYDGSANIAIGDDIVSTAAGRFIEYLTGTHDQGARLGKALAVKASGSADDLVRVRLRFAG